MMKRPCFKNQKVPFPKLQLDNWSRFKSEQVDKWREYSEFLERELEKEKEKNHELEMILEEQNNNEDEEKEKTFTKKEIEEYIIKYRDKHGAFPLESVLGEDFCVSLAILSYRINLFLKSLE